MKANQTTLIHAVELDDAGDSVVKVLCGKAKVESVLDDSTLYDAYPVNCPACVRILRKKGIGKPV